MISATKVTVEKNKIKNSTLRNIHVSLTERLITATKADVSIIYLFIIFIFG